MKMFLNLLAVLMILGVAWFTHARLWEKPKQPALKQNAYTPDETNQFLQTLDTLGYFKFADPKTVPDIQAELRKSHMPEGALTTAWDDDTHMSKDRRLYHCDGEGIFEAGGISNILAEMQPTFDKMGFEINITNHIEAWDSKNEWLDHEITINGTRYIIFQHFKGYGWGEAVMRLAQILNRELELQGINERLYLISGGNDGLCVFMTPELHAYISTQFPASEERPLAVNVWAKDLDDTELRYFPMSTK